MKLRFSTIILLGFISILMCNADDENENHKLLIKVGERAKMAQLAYVTDEEILKKYPTADIFETRASRVRTILLKPRSGGEQALIIRGTRNSTNFWTDAQFALVKDFMSGVRLHKGFYLAAREIFWEIILHLDPQVETVIVGHSLGGAVGVIVAMFLMEIHYPVKEVITFGQPRVTDESGTVKFESMPLLRITAPRDIVSQLPPLFLGYRHFGKRMLVWEGTYELDESRREQTGSKAENPALSKIWNQLIEGERNQREFEGTDSFILTGELLKKLLRWHRMPFYIQRLLFLIFHPGPVHPTTPSPEKISD